MMRYGIIGTGAVGGYYGGLLAKSGRDVRFLLRSDYLHVKKEGLRVESKDGDYSLPTVNAYADARGMPECDVVIVALKTTENRELTTILPHVVKKNGIVIAFQNGIGIERDFAGIVPDAVVMGGLCFLCSKKIGPGHIRHSDYGTVTLGEYAPGYKAKGITRNLELLCREFEESGISVKTTGDLGQARWRKLVWNVPFSGLSVVLNAKTDQLIQCSATRSLARDIMMEVIGAARQCGYSIEEKFADEMLRATDEMVAYDPSMKLDYEAGRRLEIEKMYWQPVAEAESFGYTMKTVRTLALQLEYLDHKQIPP